MTGLYRSVDWTGKISEFAPDLALIIVITLCVAAKTLMRIEKRTGSATHSHIYKYNVIDNITLYNPKSQFFL